MDELTHLAQSHIDLISAYDERQRLFNVLRNLHLKDTSRKQAAAEYSAAAKHFDEMRKVIVK